MKIECPNCHLAGNLNEVNIPDEGRNIPCPRCKTSFYVQKPQPDTTNPYRTTVCPACSYSTFTDETFLDCPKCGISVQSFQERKQQSDQGRERPRQDDLPLPAQSLRNPDLAPAHHAEAESPQPAAPPQAVKIAAAICFLAGAGLLCYGIYGLVKYYGSDWRAILSEPLLEPLSKINVFFRMAFVPWTITLFSIVFIAITCRFLMLRQGADREMAWSAWGGMAVGFVHEIWSFAGWVRISSSTPSLFYYLTGIVSSLLTAALWAAPFFLLLWFLETDDVAAEFH